MPPPDADIFPHATGAAEPTVSQHQKEESLKLYAGWFCPFVQRVWTVLEEKKIPFQYVEVNPYHKPESLLKLNPRGLVPTLQVSEGKPLYESTVIQEYLEEAYPKHGPKLLPQDLYERARMRLWSDWVTTRFIPSFFRFLQSEHDQLEQNRAEFLEQIKTFTKEMHPEGPYFLGAEPSIIDFNIGPFAIRDFLLEHFKPGGLGVPKPGQGGADEAVWNRWRKYNDAVRNRDSFKKTTSEQEHYMPIYQRYADNVAESEMAKATRSGRGVP